MAIKAALAVGATGLLWMLASSVVGGGRGAAVQVLLLALAPIAIYLGLRAPMLFPFGLYILLTPLDPLLAFSGFVGPTLTRAVGAATIAALGAHILLHRRMFAPPKSWYPWLAALAYMTSSTLWSLNPENTLVTLQVMFQNFLLFTLLAVYPVRQRELRIVFRTVMIAGTLAALYSFRQWLTDRPAADAGTRLYLTNGRLSFDPNHFAAFFILSLALVVCAFMCERRLSVRLGLGAMFAVMATSVLFSGSRGAFLAIAAIIIYAGLRLRQYVSLAAIGAAGVGLVLLIPTTLKRFTDPTQGQGSGRTDIWKVGFRALHDYWFAGAGFAAFPDAYDLSLLKAGQHDFQGWSRVGHNLIVQTSVELGIVGLALVLFAWWVSFRQNTNIPREHPFFRERIAVEACVLGLFCDAMTLDLLWYKYFWLALSLGVLLANVYRPRLLFSPRVLDDRANSPRLRLPQLMRRAAP